VTIPYPPPPPRSAQKRSGSLPALTVRGSPSAVTTSIAFTRLQAQPYLRPSQLNPPPSVYPATPTFGEVPGIEHISLEIAASATSSASAPASARALSLSMATSRMRSVLIRITPSSGPNATAP
jgi:hypothetical protein